jgi:hypothetical protein
MDVNGASLSSLSLSTNVQCISFLSYFTNFNDDWTGSWGLSPLAPDKLLEDIFINPHFESFLVKHISSSLVH